jgi:hypothetical protein
MRHVGGARARAFDTPPRARGASCRVGRAGGVCAGAASLLASGRPFDGMTRARPHAASVAAATLATQRWWRAVVPRVRWLCAQLKERTRLALTRRGVA